jgi:hypothetical protein
MNKLHEIHKLEYLAYAIKCYIKKKNVKPADGQVYMDDVCRKSISTNIPTLSNLESCGFYESPSKADEQIVFQKNNKLYQTSRKNAGFLAINLIYNSIKDKIPDDKVIVDVDMDTIGIPFLFFRFMNMKNKMIGFSKYENKVRMAKTYDENIEIVKGDGYKSNLTDKVVFLGFSALHASYEQVESILKQKPYMIIISCTIVDELKNNLLGISTKIYHNSQKMINYFPAILNDNNVDYELINLNLSYVTPFFPIHVLITKVRP